MSYIEAVSETINVQIVPPDIATTLSISAPSSVEPGANIAFTGKLARADTGAGISGKQIRLEQPPGTVIGVTYTLADGSYNYLATAPSIPGTYEYRTSFIRGGGETAPGVSRTLGLGVGVLPAWVIPVGILSVVVIATAVAIIKS